MKSLLTSRSQKPTVKSFQVHTERHTKTPNNRQLKALLKKKRGRARGRQKGCSTNQGMVIVATVVLSNRETRTVYIGAGRGERLGRPRNEKGKVQPLNGNVKELAGKIKSHLANQKNEEFESWRPKALS